MESMLYVKGPYVHTNISNSVEDVGGSGWNEVSEDIHMSEVWKLHGFASNHFPPLRATQSAQIGSG